MNALGLKVLFSGASSFTGAWFIKTLVDRGCRVVACFSKDISAYCKNRGKRVRFIQNITETVFNCPFSSQKFLDVIRQHSSWDLYCHHAAVVENYRSSLYDPLIALASNTKGIQDWLKQLKEKSCSHVLLTGSFFERNEGQGPESVKPMYAYGLAKSMTTDIFQHYLTSYHMYMARFVLPNPFGPMEDENRFTSYLASQWLQDQIPVVKTPRYLRDNIEVSLLAKAYADFAHTFASKNENMTMRPSGYVETMKNFSLRFAKNLEMRWKRSCPLQFNDDHAFTEPKMRLNCDILDEKLLGWNEAKAWDEIADFYKINLAC